MKRALKIIIPLILIFALLGGAVWYFGFYNRPMTVNMLLSISTQLDQGRFGNASLQFYNYAYNLSGHDPEIAIDLAESYRARGNYTKAEFTLVNAIAQKPSVALYLALSQTYVAQDKLLDAATMLDQISDADIKAQLDAIRPAAPTAKPEPGFYNNYVEVSLENAGGTMYFTTNGTYPSILDTPYEGPQTLGAGETTIIALSVGENGLVSSRSIFGYTVDGVIENVTLSDSALDQYVRTLLEKDASDTLRSDELWSITEMELPAATNDFSDLSRFTGLTSLTVQGKSNFDYQALAALQSLTSLDLSGCRPSKQDLEIIAALPKLTALNLSDCGLSNIEPLSAAAGLVNLDLSDNSIRNITSLSGLLRLQSLSLYRNTVEDVAALAGLTELTSLDLSYNALTALPGLSSCVKLESLKLANNQISSLAPLSRLTSLKVLDVSHNSLTDVSHVGNCTALTELNLSHNTIKDVSALKSLTQASKMDLSYNDIVTVPNFPNDSLLSEFNGAHNLVEDVSGLANLQHLTYVDLDYNNLKDVSPLLSCSSLVQLNVFGTNVSEVGKFLEMDVIVNFDPTN